MKGWRSLLDPQNYVKGLQPYLWETVMPHQIEKLFKEPIIKFGRKKYNTWNKTSLEGLNSRFAATKERTSVPENGPHRMIISKKTERKNNDKKLTQSQKTVRHH